MLNSKINLAHDNLFSNNRICLSYSGLHSELSTYIIKSQEINDTTHLLNKMKTRSVEVYDNSFIMMQPLMNGDIMDVQLSGNNNHNNPFKIQKEVSVKEKREHVNKRHLIRLHILQSLQIMP